MIQAFIPKRKLTPYMEKANIKSISISTIFSIAFSSFSFAELVAEDKIGTMLPCNVNIQQLEDGVKIAAVDPVGSIQAIYNPNLGERLPAKFGNGCIK